MKLLLLHGPAISISRQKLVSLKQKFDPTSVVVFEGEVGMQEIMGSLMTLPLLSDERLVILENPPEDYIFDSCDSSDSLTLILWFDHELSLNKTILKWVKEKGGEVLFFPEGKEVSVFPFLDYLAAGDKKAFLELMKLKSEGFDIFYFVTMVFYLLRTLVKAPKNAPQYVLEKLIRQRKNFDLEKIKKLYKQILEIEFKLKSGLVEQQQAEFLLINLFTY